MSSMLTKETNPTEKIQLIPPDGDEFTVQEYFDSFEITKKVKIFQNDEKNCRNYQNIDQKVVNLT